MKLNDKVYKILKWIAIIVLPALGTFVFTISQIWGLHYGEEINGTISAMATFLGAVLMISTANYNKSNSSSAS